ncbi:MAG: hypothetical protein Q8O00_11805 [Holophaga sp.]|nr:hypothetical protein [Holophaga sp.]
MAKFRPAVYSLATGEISPDMAGRVDIDKYQSSCRRCRNMITRPHGSAYRRPGSRHILPAKHADKLAVLMDFDFNSTANQSYVIEAGHQYLRFYMNGGVILAANGQPYEVATPWTEAQVAALRYWQSSDVLYLTHGNVAPRNLIRRGHADWTLETLDFRIPGWDLEITDGSGDTKKDGKQNDTLALADGREFDAKMIVKGTNPAGAVRWFEYHGTGFWKAEGAVKTLTFKDAPSLASGSLEIKAIHDANGKLNSAEWTELESDSSAPKEWTGTNWPRLMCMYEDRAVYAATPEQPLNYWCSRTGKYTDLRKNTASTGDPLDDDAIWRRLSGSRINPIMWMVDTEDLFMGTNASEVRVWSGTDGEPIKPKACQGKRTGGQGACDVPGQLVGSSVLYVSRSGRKVRQLAFRSMDYRYSSQEITLFAQHITGPGICEISYAVEPDGVLWCARKDGLLAGCTYLPDQNVSGWHQHELGGEGKVESLASIPGALGDELWMLVRRKNADGTTRRDIERLESVFEPMHPDGTAKQDASTGFFVDSGLSYSGVAVTQVGGLGHLEGKTVQVLADGSVLTPRVVTGGAVTLDRPSSLVHVGLAYVSEVETMPLDIPVQFGTTQATKKRVTSAVIRVLNSVGGEVAAGTSPDRRYEAFTENASQIVPGQARKLITADRRVNLSAGSELDAVVSVRQTEPLPLTVICIFPEVVL